jgi:protein N-terminal glutamine amidohydrolase
VPPVTTTPDRNSFLYTPYYCEENVWQLCQAPALAKFECKAVFMTNAMRACAFLNQRAAPSADHLMFWDYHVVVLANSGTASNLLTPSVSTSARWEIWDLDTRLGMPVSVDEYIACTFPQHPETRDFQPLFRVVDSDEFLATFSSDRSHMRNQHGEWLQPPPPWDPICRDGIWNLIDFLDTNPGGIGFLLDRPAFLKRFA